jgi:hypothetical protein
LWAYPESEMYLYVSDFTVTLIEVPVVFELGIS